MITAYYVVHCRSCDSAIVICRQLPDQVFGGFFRSKPVKCIF